MHNRSPFSGSIWLLAALTALLVGGCNHGDDNNSSHDTPQSVGPLRVFVIDDESLAEGIERRWKAQAEGEIQVTSMSRKEFLETEKPEADAVIYPAGLLGELAERKRIEPFPDLVLKSAASNRLDIFPLVRFQIVGWGERVYAVPLGSPQLTLYYRADIFKQLDLTPPTTWTEYQALVQRLSREQLGESAPPQDQPWQATVEPLGRGWAGQVLLARAAAYARMQGRYSALFNYISMKPLIDGPAFVRALEEMKASANKANDFSPHDARREFYAGRCAMALSWPSRSGDDAAQEKRPNNFRLGFAELPGSPEAFHVTTDRWETRPRSQSPRVPLLAVAGRLGSVIEGTRNVREARDFLIWLSSAQRDGEISTISNATTMFRSSHLSSPGQWLESGASSSARQYANVVQEAQSRKMWMFSVRIPGRDEYLSALDEAVHRTLSGKQSATDSLAKAARQWSQITEKYGAQDQQRAYERSLGLEP